MAVTKVTGRTSGDVALTDQPETKRLTTIVSIDVVGFSARVETNETDTLASVAVLQQRIVHLAADHSGRLFKAMGDGFLLEFPTVSGALEFADALRAEPDPPIRIGIHLGEVAVVAGGDLLGHGVNIAARLQALAPTGGILVSADVQRAVRGSLGERLAPKGQVKLDKMRETLPVFVLKPIGVTASRWQAPTSILRTGRRGLIAGGAVLGLGALAAGGYAFFPRPASADPLVAVLPFDNLSPDPQLGYFADGLAEDILNVLIAGGARVTSGTSSFTFRGPAKAQAAKVLKADYTLDGSVLRQGGRLRVNAELVDTRSQRTLWSKTFDRDVAESALISDEIARQVADAMNIRLATRKVQKSIDPGVYELYLKGREASRNHDAAILNQGRGMMQEVVRRAPAFAEGWYELAKIDWRSAYLTPIPEQRQRFEEGKAAARRAIELDPRNGGAYSVIAEMTEYFGHWAEIEMGMLKALSLSPNDPYVLLWRGHYLYQTGRTEAALAMARRAYTLDPLELFTNHLPALICIWRGEFVEAQAMVEKLEAGWPGQLAPYWDRFWLMATSGREQAAIDQLSNKSVARPTDQTNQDEILIRALSARLSQDQSQRTAAGRDLIELAQKGLGYACNSLMLLGSLNLQDEAIDLARSIYLDRGSIKIDRSVQFLGNSRYPGYGEAETSPLFHPFLKTLRHTGKLAEVFDGIGLTAFWKRFGQPNG